MSERPTISCPTHIQLGDAPPQLALTRDLNERGAVLLTQSPLPIGSGVALSLYFGGGAAAATPAKIDGEVMRIEDWTEKSWPHAVLVRFARLAPDLAESFRALDLAQARVAAEPPVTPLERRKNTRIAVYLAVQVELGGIEHAAMMRDFSPGGALMLSRFQPDPGDAIAMRFYINEEQQGVLRGAVLRCLPWKHAAIWRHSIGVRWDEPATLFGAAFQNLARSQKAFGLVKG